MKYIPSIAFEEMSGSAKGVTAAKTHGRKYIRNRGYGGGFKSSAQSAVNSIFKQLSQSWRALSNAQILSWNALANTQKGKSVLGTSSKISGANLYSRLNFWIVKSGGTAVSDPPALVGVESPASAEVVCSGDTFTLQLPEIPASVENLKLEIMASAPQSNGITKAYSKAVQIGDVREVVNTAIDLKADYEATHGQLTAASPKVFMKYFFVNTVTGEKSGEMLIDVIFTEA